jgi:hypothetical protein
MRYVPADLEEAGSELIRRATEVAGWLDAAAEVPAETADTALVDLACYQALSAAEQRLRAAGGAVRACLSDMSDIDGDIARRMIKGEP